VNSLLGEFDLTDRIFEAGEIARMEHLMDTSIDYSRFNERKEQVRQSSYAFLEQALFGQDK